jgi:hypothetical protein
MVLADFTTPDHATIARFVGTLGAQIKSIFLEVLALCAQLDLIGGEVFALDGCKLPSNASKEWTGTHNELRRKHAKLAATIDRLVADHQASDLEPEQARAKAHLEAKRQKIEDFLASAPPKLGSRGAEVKGNITDPESGLMPSPHGVVQGYNGLALVDSKHQIVIAAETSGSGQEHASLVPMTNLAEVNLQTTAIRDTLTGAVLLADTGYHHEEGLLVLEDKGIDAYVPALSVNIDVARSKAKCEVV